MRLSPEIHISVTNLMTSPAVAGSVSFVDDAVLPGDVVAGDVITLPDQPGPVLVRQVRLGRGGFIFTVRSASEIASEDERTVILTVLTHLRRHDHVPIS
jgi:hypothetical protein